MDEEGVGPQSATLGTAPRRSPLFTHVPHPHIALRRRQGPVKVADGLDRTRRWLASIPASLW